jgi:Fungal protein kinase
LTPIITSNSIDKEDEDLKPDVVIYQNGFTKAVKANSHGATSWRAMEMHIEMKAKSTHDPFSDPKPNLLGVQKNFENSSEAPRSSRGQMILYATAQLARQQRLFIFSLGIFDNFARFFRWDRAGVVVSGRIDYMASPDILAEFLWRFSHLSPIQRGHDPTVLPASNAEVKLFTDVINGSLQQMANGKDSRKIPGLDSTLDEKFPRWKMQVYDSEKGLCEFIVGKPIATPKSATGRCTRGYIALELKSQTLMFLKDTWRPDKVDIEPEKDTYRKTKFLALDHFSAETMLSTRHSTDPYQTTMEPEVLNHLLSAQALPSAKLTCDLDLKGPRHRNTLVIAKDI